MYDIIGDIHGHASRLAQLLERMGYERDAHSWRHPDRQAIFVDDFIDRGPEQIETYHLVRSMIDRGAALAVMGNHEFNAVAFKTPHPNTLVVAGWGYLSISRHDGWGRAGHVVR